MVNCFFCTTLSEEESDAPFISDDLEAVGLVSLATEMGLSVGTGFCVFSMDE